VRASAAQWRLPTRCTGRPGLAPADASHKEEAVSMKVKGSSIALWFAAIVTAIAAPVARAEVDTVHIAQQFGITYLPLMYMENQHLLEKHAKAQGLGDVKVEWVRFGSGTGMNDALISGHLDFASGGLGPFITLWAKTRGRLEVKGVCAMNNMPLYLNTRNPDVKTVRDFTSNDKIALPAVKVSFQAVNLQMAAAKAFGEKNYNKLDPLTVSMKHPDALAALLSGGSEIIGHFGSPPYQYQELENPKIHRLVNSYDVLGGPATFNVVYALKSFRDGNPKVYGAFLKALDEAEAFIKKDPHRAAEIYIEEEHSKLPVAFIEKMIRDPEVDYTTTPRNVMKYADFMSKIGSIDNKPASWKDLFFPEIHSAKGS
jgi:NitT/TauT family transport system substrate-binding protein